MAQPWVVGRRWKQPAEISYVSRRLKGQDLDSDWMRGTRERKESSVTSRSLA